MNRSDSTKKYPSFRRRIFFYLALLFVIVITLVWFFQIVLLKPMYEVITRRDLVSVSRELEASVGGDDLHHLADRLSGRKNVCISVYRIYGQTATHVVTSHILNGCLIHNVNEEFLMNRLYSEARGRDYYTEDVRNPFLGSGGKDDRAPQSLILADVTEDSSGVGYLIVLDAEIEPVAATSRALMVQLLIISVILLLIAAAFAYFGSDKLSRPISRMNEEAKKLALGNYDVHFEGGTAREIAELGATLNTAAQELSEMDSMQKELIANLSHDLRTPLTMIRGYGEVMRDIPGEMTADNMQIIIDETERLSRLVTDILDLSKLTKEGSVLSCEHFCLTDLVGTTLERYAKLRTHDGYTITFDADRPAYVYADSSKILQVVVNLVNNAINYTGEDKIVRIRQICEEGTCRIEVTDTGEGIPEDQLPRIWERYYKVKNYYKRAVTGTGLGLAIVKKILVLHGARFGVTSKVGEGSTFWFSLPEVPGSVSSDIEAQ